MAAPPVCDGGISASQEDIVATSPFLGGDNALPDEDEEGEVALELECISASQEDILATSPFLNALPDEDDEDEEEHLALLESLRDISASHELPDEDEEEDLALLECISASQEDILGGDNALDEDELEVLATPSDATQQQKQQQQQHDPVTMSVCTPTSSKSPAPPSDDAPLTNPRRKPRVCTRKVRTPTGPTPSPSPEQQQPEPEQQLHADPLVRALLMIPTKTTAAAATSGRYPEQEFLALARRKGLI